MATSHFFIQPDQRNTQLGEIRTEPAQKSRGRKPGSKTNQPNNQKKQRQRGMGVAQLERLRVEEEKKKQMVPNPNLTFLPIPVPDPVVVLQGFPSYSGATGCRNRFYCPGGVWSGPVMIDPVCSPWATHDQFSSFPNPQVYNHPCDTCFKKKRLDGDHNVSKCSPMKEYDHDHGSKEEEEFGSFIEGNPRNESGVVKEYEFFPRKYDNFPGKYGNTVSVDTSVGDFSPNTSTIDLSLKL